MGFLSQIFDTIQSLFITIPLDNAFAYGYVILSAIVQLFALFSFGGADGGGGILGK